MKKLLLMFVGIVCSLMAMGATYEWSHNGALKTLSVTAAKGTGSASTYSGYEISYGGAKYATCIKMESATTLTFKTTKTSTITVGVALKNNVTYNAASNTALSLTTDSEDPVTANTGITSSTTGASKENGLEVVFASVPAGTQVIKRAGSEEGVFYIRVEEEDASKVNKPSISAVWGASYGNPTTVTISSTTADATIYYTTNGDNPTSASTAYTGSFTVNAECTVKAIATKNGMSDSEVASQAVTINNLRNIAFDFSGVTLTQGSAIANTTSANNVAYKLPNGRMYFVEGQTQTGWNDGANDYALGGSVTTDKDYTFAPVFEENQVALGDAEATVNWTFATANGAPSAGIEGNIGYYAAQTTINDKKLDVVMTINATQDAAFPETRGKWNTTSASNRAQVNKGTIFTIPAISGMVVTYTATNGTPKTTSATFAGQEGTVDGMDINYTYNGSAATIDIIDCGDNLYPSGIKVVYPIQETGEESDLDVEHTTIDVQKDKTYRISFSTSSTGAVTATSNKNDIATATIDGNQVVITAVAAGTATITVSQEADATYKSGEKTITVTVTDPTVPTAIYTANATKTAYSVAAGANATPVDADYVTTTGGTMTVSNGQSKNIELTSTQGSKVCFAETNGNTFYGVTLTGTELKAGDVISAEVYTRTDNAIGLLFSTSATYTSTGDAKAEAEAQATAWVKVSYTVAEEDGICGESSFNIFRSQGKTTYFKNFTITRAATIAEATLNAKGFGTFSSAYPVKISGAKVYVATLNIANSKIVATEVETGEVPAGTGVLLAGEDGATVTASYKADAAPLVSDNDLKATTLADGSLAAKEDALVLSGATFKNYTGAAFTAGKAYFPYAAAGAKTAFSIVFDGEATAADVVEAEPVKAVVPTKYINAQGQIIIGNYNAAGQQVK